MSEVIKIIKGVDKLFSEIEINNVTYKTAKGLSPSTTKESTTKESTTSLTETVSSDPSNVSGVNLNSIYHAIEDTNARANVKTALLQIINEIIVREQADTQLQDNINTEAQTREASDIQLQDNINTEKSIRSSADTQLQKKINAEAQTRETNDTQLQNSVDTINSKIPSQATEDNQLADKDFVNSSIATNTANFIGTFTDINELKRQTATNNDYAYYQTVDSAGNTLFERWKYKASTSAWAYEYTLNNSSFTADEWASIQSGITENQVSSYDSHLNNTSNPHSVTKAQVGLGNVGNFKAVSTVASQGLSATEKSNARANIGAGTSNFSGSYNDLTNKPTIPSGQLQSDWNQSDTNAVDYIKNKPTIPSTTTFLKIDGSNATMDGTSAIVHSLKTAEANITDDTEIITSSINGYSNSDKNYYRRTGLRFYNYIKGKLDSVFVPLTRKVNGHDLSSDVTVTKSDVGLGSVANTGDSATPTSGGTTKFTTGGAYTELAKKVNKSDACAYKYYGSPNGRTYYFTITCSDTYGGIIITTGYNSNLFFDANKNAPFAFTSSTNYGVLGYAWSSDGKKLYIKVTGYRPISVTIPSIKSNEVGIIGQTGIRVNFSDWSTTAPADVTFVKTVHQIDTVNARNTAISSASSLALTSASNLNLSLVDGNVNRVLFHYFASNATNAPVATAGFVITHCMSTTSAIQIAYCGTQIFTRTLSGTTWSAWNAMWNTEES